MSLFGEIQCENRYMSTDLREAHKQLVVRMRLKLENPKENHPIPLQENAKLGISRLTPVHVPPWWK